MCDLSPLAVICVVTPSAIVLRPRWILRWVEGRERLEKNGGKGIRTPDLNAALVQVALL
jgi:hypothetical protein